MDYVQRRYYGYTIYYLCFKNYQRYSYHILLWQIFNYDISDTLSIDKTDKTNHRKMEYTNMENHIYYMVGIIIYFFTYNSSI